MYENKLLISIIVPAYNAENYICKCIDSVLAQTYENIELIIVNDGSIDQTGKICDLYAEKNTRVRVINKKNEGVSAARNTGISEARGNLICFLDADDWLSPNIIQVSIDKFVKGCLNIWGATEYLTSSLTNHEDIIVEKLSREELVANAIYRIPNSDYNLGTYFRAVWGKLFEKSIIDEYDITFPENLYMGEDAVFLVNYLMHISDINIVKGDGYNYNRMNECSATTKYHDDLYEQCKIQYESILEAVIKNSLDRSMIISDSIINFRWWIVTVLVDNAVKGVMNKKLSIKNMMIESEQWIETYKTEMKESMINSCYIGKRHKNLYYHRNIIDTTTLIKYYLLPQVMSKLRKKCNLKNNRLLKIIKG